MSVTSDVPVEEAVPVVDLWDDDRVTAWQDYHLSGMPDLLSSLNLCHALLALANSGLLDRLRSKKSVRTDELLAGMDERVGRGLLRYLEVRGVLTEHAGEHALSHRGALLTSGVALARLGFYLEAYGPVTGRMTDLLTGAATYGVDVTRAGAQLGKHSGTVSTASYTPTVLHALRSRSARTLLDLGCGGGSLLVEIATRHPQLRGVGMDLSPDAIADAQALAERAGVADRIRFVVGDAFAPGTWPEDCREMDVVCGVGVLHELFRDGDQAVVDVLDRFAAMLSDDAVVLIGEPELRYDDRENDSDFFLMHVLTAQGIPRDTAGWLPVFGASALRCTTVYANAVAGPRTRFYELERR
ncbi:SAM-dependent methyltransferase [Amycolatopsis coloradensis]|uniref:SAM-dependent methyltransferase n=1 Tax=Amycolatopsis coloradensis TaxID=76021 RepID=A0A1R0KQY6_9PSEU|nr:class I SAM-dependent methyltransferase [Amycolatopsis coloradensis]OLZ50100.1 SAM-dependent methyltransferase [Amycolatopsis coloradensis]